MSEKLSPEQQAAVNADEHRILCVAGPGSGKTRVLTERAMRLLVDCPRDQLVVLTFTRLAAQQMEQRLIESGCPLPFMGTIHAWCLYAMRTRGSKATVIDDMEAQRLLAECNKTLGYDIPAGKISKAVEQYYGSLNPIADRKMLRVFEAYRAQLKGYRCVDYGLLQVQALKGGVRFDDIRHVLIDELQDCSIVQLKLLESMFPNADWFGVGDWDQQLYRWRYAVDVQTADAFWGPDVQRHALSESYRCPGNVLGAARTLAPESSLYGFMHSRKADEPIRRIHGFTDVVPIMQEEVTQGGRWADWAFLCRGNRRVDRVQAALLDFGVPAYIPVLPFRALQQHPEAYEMTCALRLVVNSTDRMAMRGMPRWLEAGVRACRPHSDVMVAFDRIAQEHRKPATYDATRRIMERLVEQFDIATVADMVDFLALSQPSDQFQPNCDMCPVLTVHRAKGLEWPNVVMVGLNDREWPSSPAIEAEIKGDGSLMRDEDCVTYVAMTRASRRLYLHCDSPESQMGRGEKRIRPPSRYYIGCPAQDG